MKSELSQLERRYSAKLRRYLRGDPELKGARALGGQAAAAGMEMLDVARIHAQALRGETSLRGKPSQLSKRADLFFAEVIAPIEAAQTGAGKAAVRLRKLIEALDRRTIDLAASNRELKEEVGRRAEIEEALHRSERYHTRLLAESVRMQEQLRNLSHQILSAQEEERKRISRELHDQIAGVLTGINIELSSLRREAVGKDEILNRKIERTQRMVLNSVEVVHAFARDLRPTVLDDLGLIPALRSFVRTHCKHDGLHVRINVPAELGKVDGQQQTVLYRVAQEALTNVVKHARAKRVDVTLETNNGTVSLRIKDNGRSFRAGRLLFNSEKKRLGLLGMRERVEMVGGTFRVESARGKGTTVHATIPLDGDPEKGRSGRRTS